MSRLFSKRITEPGKNAIHDLLDNLVEKTRHQGVEGFSAVEKYGWIPALIYFCCGEHDKSLSLAHDYVSQSKEVHGDNSNEVVFGLFILSINYNVLKRDEELSITRRWCESIQSDINETPAPFKMAEDVLELATAYRRQCYPRSAQRAFLAGLVTLSLAQLIDATAFRPDIMDQLFGLFRSLNFPSDKWQWLLRRCLIFYTDFVGLVSVLIDEGLFPSETMTGVGLGPAPERAISRNYEKVQFVNGRWESCENNYSEGFPTSIAEEELSMRVEGLIAEGYRHLNTTGELNPVVFIFSSRSTQRLIQILQVDVLSDQESDELEDRMTRAMAENQADSVMLLMWVNTDGKHITDLSSSSKTYTDGDIVVEARDAKSYLVGSQAANRVNGKIVFNEPVVLEAEKGLLSEFTFPVQPESKKLTGQQF